MLTSKRAARDDHDEETAPGVVSITELSTSCLRSWSRGVDPPAAITMRSQSRASLHGSLARGGRDSIPSPKRGCSFLKGKYLRRRDTHESPGFSVFAVVQIRKTERGTSRNLKGKFGEVGQIFIFIVSYYNVFEDEADSTSSKCEDRWWQ